MSTLQPLQSSQRCPAPDLVTLHISVKEPSLWDIWFKPQSRHQHQKLEWVSKVQIHGLSFCHKSWTNGRTRWRQNECTQRTLLNFNQIEWSFSEHSSGDIYRELRRDSHPICIGSGEPIATLPTLLTNGPPSSMIAELPSIPKSFKFTKWCGFQTFWANHHKGNLQCGMLSHFQRW